jgi:hypothetical protein
MTILRIVAVILTLAGWSSPSWARPQPAGLHPDCGVRFPCEVPTAQEAHRRVISAPAFPSYRRTPENEPAPQSPVVVASSGVVEHPEGCPRRAFCACGASVRVFGRSIPSLWPAVAWYRFPRAEPAPGRAAVRPHHVFVLERQIRGNVWMVYDANSGRHLTRIHARSIAGYVIVNPRS